MRNSDCFSDDSDDDDDDDDFDDEFTLRGESQSVLRDELHER
jgi:hypothetical protein